MIVTTSYGGPGLLPAARPGTVLLAAVDVEWSKNYRIVCGNVPFCYSAVWLGLPAAGGPGGALTPCGFGYRSAYVEATAETGELVAHAGAMLAAVLGSAGLITGHQLCSDLSVLAKAGGEPPQAVGALQQAWRQRRTARWDGPAIIDTRYDAGHLLSGASRRLVDVCTELGLDVTQPELRGTSMTALHRRWLDQRDPAAREKITVLNLRHALSTALVAARAAGLGGWPPGLNVNRLLAEGLDGAFAWLADPVFTGLLADADAA